MPDVAAAGGAIRLKRGGVLVRTSIGAVQFGAPPETIKDALAAGLDVPSVYVLPDTWFGRRRGRTLAELEFPAYYNYFLHGGATTAVCDADGRRRITALLRESLFGPEHIDLGLDYAPQVAEPARADLARECSWFRRRPEREGAPAAAGTDRIELADVIAFTLFDATGRAHLGAVEIQRIHDDRGPAGWQVFDGGAQIAEVRGADLEPASADPSSEPVIPATPFAPPWFGVTVLGSSHGFDPSGKTTGFVLWVGRRGILVDPPADATEMLQAAGVPARQVDAVILTHCHADHDSGVFQKILEEGRVSVYTTPTIMGSFLRKYRALTGETEEQLRRLFVFRPVTIGAKQRIHGAEFRFFYSLHSIPTIGFECYLQGKSCVYSADSLWDVPRIEEMRNAGVMTPQRAEELIDFPWHHSLVLHEAGVPPVHTPVARLAALPPAVKERLRLMHIAEANVPAGQGLRLARPGFEHSIELSVEESPHAAALAVLDALLAIDLFHELPIERGREFLTIARRELHPAGALVIGQGETGDRFYILVRGEAAVVKDGVVIKTYRDGDFFGETALVTGAPRSADVRAKTDLEVLAIDKYDFLSFLRDTDLADALVRLARNRDLPSWNLMDENAALRAMSAMQRTQLQALLEPVQLVAGQVVWEPARASEAAWILESAVVEYREDGAPPVVLGRAAYLGDAEAILRAVPPAIGRGAQPGATRSPSPAATAEPASPPPVGPAIARAEVIRAGAAFRLDATSFATFLRNNPGLLLSLSGSQFVD